MMKKFYLTLATGVLLALPVFGQTSLIPEYGYAIATWFPDYPNIGAFDFSDTLFYLNDGDTIHMLNIYSGVELKKFGVPEDYSDAYASFLTLSPDGHTIWAGYTTIASVDDRIYSIDVESGEWKHRATFPGNLDLEYWNDSILVAGLNSSSWDAPAAVFILDTTGADNHRRIIEPGGYSAGMAIDEQNNLYYGTSYALDPNALYRWDEDTVRKVVEHLGESVLLITDAEKLSDLPAGVYDCEVDEGGHVLFNMNLDGGVKAVCKWNGMRGDGQHIDTLATASGEWDWLGNIKSRGDIGLTEPGNMAVTYSFGQPLAKLNLKNTVGVAATPAPEFSIYPNPSRGLLSISSDRTEVIDVRVYTLQGSQVYAVPEFTSGGHIDLSNLAAGSYILRLRNDTGSSSIIILRQ
jgi:hypothetical protein